MKLGKIVGMVLVAGLTFVGTSAMAQHRTGAYYNTLNQQRIPRVVLPSGTSYNTGYHPRHINTLDPRTVGGSNNTGYHPRPNRFGQQTYGGYNNRNVFQGRERIIQSYSCGTYMQGGRRCYK